MRLFPTGRSQFLALLFLTLLPLLWYATPLFTDQTYFETDFSGQYAPWWDYARSRFLQGEFPLWNPFVFGGTPYHVNPENALYYPFRLLLAFTTFWTGVGWIRVMDSIAASIGMFLLLRAFRLGIPGALTGALTFTYGSFFAYEFIHMPYIHTATWCPWQLLAIHHLMRRPGIRTIVALAIVTAISFLGGSPGVFVICQMAAGVFFIFAVLQEPKDGLLRNITAAAMAVFIFAGLTCILWLPTLNFAELTPRHSAASYLTDIIRSGLSPEVIRTMFFPMHDLALGAPYPPAYTNQFLFAPYIGMPAILLAVLGLSHTRGRSIIIPTFVVMFILGTVLAMGTHTGLFPTLFRNIPLVRWFRWPHDYALLAYLALTVLCACGVDSVWRRPRRTIPRLLMVTVPYVLIAFYLLPARETAIGILCAIMPFLAIIPWLLRRTRRMAWLGSILWLGMLGADLFIYSSGFRHYMPASTFDMHHIRQLVDVAKTKDPLARVSVSTLKPSYCSGEENYLYSFLPITRNPIHEEWDFTSNMTWLRRVPIGPQDSLIWNRHRLFTFSNWEHPSWTYPINMAMTLGYQDMAGYDPFIIERVTELFKTLPIEKTWALMNVRFVITPNRLQIPGYQSIHDSTLGYVYEQTNVAPRAYVAYEVHTNMAALDVLAFLKDSDQMVGHTALLETGVPASVQIGTPVGIITDSVSIIDYAPERVILKSRTSESRLIVLHDMYCPGWKASVDGKPVEILRANYLFRSVAVPSGDHEIVFTFEPDDFQYAAWITGLAWLGVLLAGITTLRLSRRKLVGKAETGRHSHPNTAYQMDATKCGPPSKVKSPVCLAACAGTVLLLLAYLGNTELRPIHRVQGWPVQLPALRLAKEAGAMGAKIAQRQESVILYQDSTFGMAIEVPATAQPEFWIVARGTPADGIYPALDIECDGRPLERIYCASDEWALYRVPFDTSPGLHNLRVSYINDEFSYPEDRNLEIQVMGLGQPPDSVLSLSRQAPVTWEAAKMSRSIMCDHDNGLARLWPGGQISEEFVIPAGSHLLALWVLPSTAAQGTSHLDVLLDGQLAATCLLTGTEWSLIQLPLEAVGGRQLLTLRHRSPAGRKSAELDLLIGNCGLDVEPPRAIPFHHEVSINEQLMIDLAALQRPSTSSLTNGVLTLWSNGHLMLGLTSSVQQTVYFGLLASGTPCDGVWPKLRMSVDDDHLATFHLAAPIPLPLGKRFILPPGPHRIILQYDNDAQRATGEDRNILIHGIQIAPDSFAPEDSLGPPMDLQYHEGPNLLPPPS